MNQEKFSYEKYMNYLLSNDNKNVAEEYRMTFIPNKLYKYASFPDSKERRNKRIEGWKNEQLWFSLKEALNDPFEFKNAVIRDASIEARQYYEETTSDLAVLCLTTNQIDKLMWAHYADSYRGFCVELSKDYRSWEHFSPVDYFSERPNYSELYQKFFDLKDQIIRGEIQEYYKFVLALSGMCCLKDVCWQYESEFRCFEKINMNANTCKDNGYYFSAHEEGTKITKFTLGLKTTNETKEQIVSICQHINSKRFNNLKQGHEDCDNAKVISVMRGLDDIVQIDKLSIDDNLNLHLNSYAYELFW